MMLICNKHGAAEHYQVGKAGRWKCKGCESEYHKRYIARQRIARVKACEQCGHVSVAHAQDEAASVQLLGLDRTTIAAINKRIRDGVMTAEDYLINIKQRGCN